ncbi:DUF1801 domain-containing protein [Hyalangium versicolor]|uniref:DUF1801 domain-containing protein n=1 Tax=Hyalangium versicolor TaxID=2861190 RepID=UPI001CC984F4|nr:DUF1801 domain-containing protein [Hyalangium versicolor]
MKRTPEKPPQQRVRTKKGASPQRSSGEPATKRTTKGGPDSSQTDPAVVSFLEELDHPLKKEIEAVRKIILGADPAIREAIKWKAPSFRTTDFFATFHLRSTDRLQLVFHMGAKVKATATTGIRIDDPAGLLEWLAKDRCLVTLGAGKDIAARKAALEALVREWIRWL